MITKEKLQDTINKLPDAIELDDLIEKLILLDKIDKGNNQSLLNDVVTEEELDKTIQQWFK